MSSHTDSFVASGTSPTQPKKRGRPPKNGRTMTPAERKAASRQNQRQQQQDVEHQGVIAKLKQMYGRHLRESELRGVPTELLRLSLEDSPIDTRGRLPGERQTRERGLEYFAAAQAQGGRRVRPSGSGPDS